MPLYYEGTVQKPYAYVNHFNAGCKVVVALHTVSEEYIPSFFNAQNILIQVYISDIIYGLSASF